MWMAAGFTMLEAGLVRGKNTVVICIKNLGLFSIAGLAYYLIGYNLMYAGVDGGYIGSISIWSSGVGGADGYTFRMEGSGNTGAYIAFESELV